MDKGKLFVVLGAIVLTAGLFQLPRVVVENDQLQEVAGPTSHSMEIPEDIREQMSQLTTLIQSERNLDKKANFAHALAGYYLDYAMLDSAVAVGGRVEEWSDGPSELVADIYFKAYERSRTSEEAANYASMAREVLNPLVEKDPSDYILRNRLAMTLVTTENPMAGISMLREILAEDENNRLTILNLGLLAIQSGQFNRAKERFEKLMSLNPEDYEAKLYLAVSMIETNEQQQASVLLEEIMSANDSIPAIKMMAMEYLEGL